MTRPVFIIGAARSGTKLLRSLLAAHPLVHAIPYDVNFIWKYDNYDLPHDELRDEHMTPRAAAFIRSRLKRAVARSGRPVLLEKTVGNALRPEFVRRVFPEARFVHLVRDGRAVAESARRMWQAPLEPESVLRKLRYLPPSAIPRYATQYAASYVRRSLSNDRRVSTWGPRFMGIDELARDRPLLDVCAMQWERCVSVSLEQLGRMPREDVLEVRYERLVEDTHAEIDRTLDFLRVPPSEECHALARRDVRSEDVEKWRTLLDPDEQRALVGNLARTLEELRYE